MIQLKWNLNTQFFIEKNVIRNVIAKMSAPYLSLDLFKVFGANMHVWLFVKENYKLVFIKCIAYNKF